MAEDEFWPDVNIASLVDYDIAWEAERRRLEYNEGTALFPRLPLRLPTGGSFSVGLNTTFRDAGTQDSYTSSPSLHFVQPLLKGGGVAVATANLRSAEAPGFRLHPLKGDRAGQWSVRVSGNWRVVFRFEDGEAVAVDLIDYH